MQKNIFPQQRDPVRGGTTLIGIIIIVAVAVVIFGGVFAYQYFAVKNNNQLQVLNENQNITDKTKIDETANLAPSEVEGWKTYTNTEYGFEFKYPNEYYGEKNIIVKENKFYVGGISGQFVELFNKKVDETLEEAIYRIVLDKYPSPECKIKTEKLSANNYRGEYIRAEIYSLSSNSNNSVFPDNSLCNEKYAQTNGLRYFIYNPLVPDKFAFLDIGQYGITIGDKNNTSWQETFKFINK
jgi:hypothetical protein